MTEPTLIFEPDSVKPPISLISEGRARQDLGDIAKPTLFRLEREHPELAAARRYVRGKKCFVADLFYAWLANYLAEPRDPYEHMRREQRADARSQQRTRKPK
jgi:hypothetical protein